MSIDKLPTDLKFPTVKQIDWKKYIQPKKQILVKTKCGADIAVLVDSNNKPTKI